MAVPVTSRPLMVFRLVAVGCAAFILLTFAAMFVYAGGTPFERDATSYRFFDNFFSDLGGTVTGSGKPNLACMVLFIVAMVTAGVSVAAFFLYFRRLFDRTPLGRRLGKAAGVCGIISAVGFVGVAATPWNYFLPEHMFCVNLAFRLLLLAVVLDTIAIWRDTTAPRACLWIFLSFGVMLVAYISLLSFGPPLSTRTGRAIQVAGQKIIIYSSIAAVGCQTVIADVLIRRKSI